MYIYSMSINSKEVKKIFTEQIYCFHLDRFLLEAGLIVFLNKQDILERKVKEGRCIGDYFPAYHRYMISSGNNQVKDEYTRTKMFIKNMLVVRMYKRFLKTTGTSDILVKRQQRGLKKINLSIHKIVKAGYTL